MFPCNFVVQEMEDEFVDVSVVDPMASMTAINNAELKETAVQTRDKLISVVDGL